MPSAWSGPRWAGLSSARASVHPSVTRKKVPKGPHIGFSTKSEHVKSLLEGPEFGIAKFTRKHGFAQSFGLEDAGNSFHLSRKNKDHVDEFLGIIHSRGILSRSASILLRKAE